MAEVCRVCISNPNMRELSLLGRPLVRSVIAMSLSAILAGPKASLCDHCVLIRYLGGAQGNHITNTVSLSTIMAKPRVLFQSTARLSDHRVLICYLGRAHTLTYSFITYSSHIFRI